MEECEQLLNGMLTKQSRIIQRQLPNNTIGTGFTLIELLMAIAIILTLAAMAASLTVTFQVSSTLNETTAQTIQTLRVARELSIAGSNNKSYGVFLII